MSNFLKQLSESTRKEFAKLGRRKGVAKLAQLLMPTIHQEYRRLLAEREEVAKQLATRLARQLTGGLTSELQVFKAPKPDFLVQIGEHFPGSVLTFKLEMQVAAGDFNTVGDWSNIATLHEKYCLLDKAADDIKPYRNTEALETYFADALEADELVQPLAVEAELTEAGRNLLTNDKVLPATSV